MTGERRQNPDFGRLAGLYRDAADAEPDARLDRNVLARARSKAAGKPGSALPNLRPWGLGLAAAASLGLAVGLGLHLGIAPDRLMQETEPLRVRNELDQARPSAPALEGEERTEPAYRPAETAALKAAPSEDRADAAPARARQEAERVPRDQQAVRAAESLATKPESAQEPETVSPGAWLERIRDLIEQNRLDQAREELRRFRSQYPSVDIPLEIRQSLATDGR